MCCTLRAIHKERPEFKGERGSEKKLFSMKIMDRGEGCQKCCFLWTSFINGLLLNSYLFENFILSYFYIEANSVMEIDGFMYGICIHRRFYRKTFSEHLNDS